MTKNSQTIMLVDDTPANLKVLFEYLESKGFKVLVATSGETALEGIAQLPPDLILLDVKMSGIDGFETCRRLKVDIATAGIPVIFMTVQDETVDVVRGFTLGAVDYITKPIQVERVLARIKTHLKIHRLQIDLENQNKKLQAALNDVKTLSDLLPICSICKKIRDDEGYWNQVEEYISRHADIEFSHSLCPTCLSTHYPDFTED
ncbi:MAG: response regulator [Desulfobacteraceae bacterium]|nr:response regulator [Desulfobacteraceae bacterium]